VFHRADAAPIASTLIRLFFFEHSFWESVASTLRGDKLSKRQQLLRMGVIGLVLFALALDRFIMLVCQLRQESPQDVDRANRIKPAPSDQRSPEAGGSCSLREGILTGVVRCRSSSPHSMAPVNEWAKSILGEPALSDVGNYTSFINSERLILNPAAIR
jgi:hypothetical protein